MLPLFDAVCATPRGAQAVLGALLSSRFDAEGEAVAAELTRALSASEQTLRFSALLHYCSRFGGARSLLPVLTLATGDVHPGVRLWAGRRILSETDATSRPHVLDLLARDGNASLRLIALREFRKLIDMRRIESACFDRNAGIRMYARRYLRKLGGTLDHRRRALELLAAPKANRHQLIGALAVLSEFGMSQDQVSIKPFLASAQAGVALEAKRTLTLLGSGDIADAP